MVDFISIGDRGEHVVPQDEQDDHCPFDFCPCHPVYRFVNGQWLWFHRVSDERDLLEQARAIRDIESIRLWREARDKQIPCQIMKFPEGYQTPSMPPAAKR